MYSAPGLSHHPLGENVRYTISDRREQQRHQPMSQMRTREVHDEPPFARQRRTSVQRWRILLFLSFVR